MPARRRSDEDHVPRRRAPAPRGRRGKRRGALAARLLLLAGVALLCCGPPLRAVDAYGLNAVACSSGCNVTLTDADTNPGRGSFTNVLWIDSKAKLDALEASVAHCADTGWRLVGGGLYVWGADDVADLEALRDLSGIGGKDSLGYSLSIRGNANLASLAGLRNLAGVLPGALLVLENDKLASLDGLERVTRIDGKADDGRSLRIHKNPSLASIAGLSGLRGALPGALSVSVNAELS